MGGQGQSAENSRVKALESLLAFWADAGVEASYADQPVNRLLQAARPRPAVALTPAAAAPAGRRIEEEDVSETIAQAKALAAGAETLEDLAAAIAGFDGCPLKFQGASRSVFARGNPNAPVMIIGEGPGGDEDRLGEPFVGRAGKLLDRMLVAGGLEGRVFITNTVFWRPPGNRTPTPNEQAICRPLLERAIFLVNPELVILAGGAAAKSMLATNEGILSLHGRWFEWENAEKTLFLPVLPTLHPAFLLRQPAAKKKAWSDILTFIERLDRPERAP